MGPVRECGPPPGLALRSSTIFSIGTPGWIWSLACISVSIETVSPESMVSCGFSRGSSQPHCTVSGVALRTWCFPFSAARVGAAAARQAASATQEAGRVGMWPPGVRRPIVSRSQRRVAALAGAEADGLADVEHEDLAVADAAGLGGVRDGVDHLRNHLVAD